VRDGKSFQTRKRFSVAALKIARPGQLRAVPKIS
jgi:hypothetical protein